MLACSLVLGACDDSAKRQAAEDLARLGPAIDALRDAPNPDKAAHLAQLRAIGCQHPELCALRSQCLAAYEAHVGALKSLHQVSEQLKRGAPPAHAQAALGQAEQALSGAKQSAQACAKRRMTVADELDL